MQNWTLKMGVDTCQVGGGLAMKPWILSSWHLNLDGVPCRETPSQAFVRVLISSRGHMVVNICKGKIFVYTFKNGMSSDYVSLRPLKTCYYLPLKASMYLQQVDRW